MGAETRAPPGIGKRPIKAGATIPTSKGFFKICFKLFTREDMEFFLFKISPKISTRTTIEIKINVGSSMAVCRKISKIFKIESPFNTPIKKATDTMDMVRSFLKIIRSKSITMGKIILKYSIIHTREPEILLKGKQIFHIYFKKT